MKICMFYIDKLKISIPFILSCFFFFFFSCFSRIAVDLVFDALQPLMGILCAAKLGSVLESLRSEQLT